MKKYYKMPNNELIEEICFKEENEINIPRIILENTDDQNEFRKYAHNYINELKLKEENSDHEIDLKLPLDIKNKIIDISEEHEDWKTELTIRIPFEEYLKSFEEDDVRIKEFWGIDLDSELKSIHDRVREQIRISLDHPLKVKDREWVLLVGGSGTGKTTAAIQYAKDKGLDYILMNATTDMTATDFKGYRSITTNIYQPSLLKDAVVNGKVFIIDEIDNADKNTLLILNSLKNNYFQFEDELVEVHPDFRLIATANTIEFNEGYLTRTPLDIATLSRFQLLEYNFVGHELSLELGHDYIESLNKDMLERILNDGRVRYTMQTVRDLRRDKINKDINSEFGFNILPTH